MKHTVLAGLLLLASCSTLPSTAPNSAMQDESANRSSPTIDRANRVTLYLGQRSLDDGDYSPVEDQATFGVEFAREPAGSVVGWEVGLLGSADEATVAGFDVEGNTSELYAGVRKSFGTGVARPFVGGGLSFINSEVEVTGIGSDDDSSPAAYGHVGVSFNVSSSFYLGIDLRLLFGSEMSIAGVETDADYSQLALHLGWSF